MSKVGRPTSLEALLLEEKLVSEAVLREAKRSALRRRVRLVEALVDDHAVDETQLADALARRLSLPRFSTGPLDEEALREVSHDLATAHLVVPVHVETDDNAQRTLRLAMVDPLDAFALEDIAHGCGCVIEPVVASLGQVRVALQRSYRGMITKMIPRAIDSATRGIEPTTQPLLQLPDESSVEVRLRAVIEVLLERGVVSATELEERVKRLVAGDET